MKSPRKRLRFSSKNQEKLFLSIKFGLYLTKFLMNFLGVLISIIDDYFYSEHITDSTRILPIYRIILTFAYICEFSSEFLTIYKDHLFQRILSPNFFLDLSTILLLSFSAICNIFFSTSEIYKISSSLEDVFLCFRILKLRVYLKFFFYFFKNDEKDSSRVLEINEIKLEFSDSVLFFISSLKNRSFSWRRFLEKMRETRNFSHRKNQRNSLRKNTVFL